MNVLLACPWPLHYRGGVTVIVQMLARGLARSGDHVCFLLPTHGKRVERTSEDDIIRYHVPMRLPVVKEHRLRSLMAFLVFLPITCLRLARIIRRERIDVVNVHYFSRHWIYFLLLRCFLRFRFVVSVHGTDVQGSEGARNVRSIELWRRYIDVIVFCSEASRKCLAPRSLLYNKAVVILNAMELNTIPAPVPETERAPYIVCSGHLQNHKGQDILLRAFAILRDEFKEISVKLVGEGPTRPELEDLIRELHLEKRVHLCGGVSREEALNLMRHALMTCAPSRRETFGLVLLESMALNVPVIASRVGGIPEVIREETDGLLVSAENVPELATAIRTVLREPALRARLTANAKFRVAEVFSQKAFLDNYRGLFQDISMRNSRAAGKS